MFHRSLGWAKSCTPTDLSNYEYLTKKLRSALWQNNVYLVAFTGMDKKMGPKLRDLAPWPRVRGMTQPRTSMYRAQSRLREIVPSARSWFF